MSSKRQVRRSECGSKRKYDTVTGAQTAAYLVGQSIGEKMDAYRCKWCRGYHIGHRTAATSQAIKEGRC